MLKPYQPPQLSRADSEVFDALVRRDHWVRRAEEHVDFLKLRQSIEPFYRVDFGCPGVEPVLLIKLELLKYHNNLSDTQVFRQAETDVAYRWFSVSAAMIICRMSARWVDSVRESGQRETRRCFTPCWRRPASTGW